MPSKSIFRQPGARHFQLVHRSQRDPLIHDPDASQHVLKEFERENVKGKTRADLEHIIPASQLAHDLDRANIGEAAAYGVYFDDTDYDYMQHLKPVGVEEDGIESILIEAPVQKAKARGSKSKSSLQFVDLPPEALPSTSELPRNYETQEAVPSSIAGFQPNMDPHLRQTLEALEDDAFVDDTLDDDFFDTLVGEGERDAEEGIDFEFHEWGSEEGPSVDVEGQGDTGGWESAFKEFKKTKQSEISNEDSELDSRSEGEDTVGSMPHFSVLGGKKRRKGSSDASGYSMSSSSIFRNEGLTTLDEKFDQIEREYASDENEDNDEDGSPAHSESDDAPELLTSRSDFSAMMNEFLDEYEILGGKMKQVLAGDSAMEKLDTIRRALGAVSIREHDDEYEVDVLLPLEDNDVKDRWDCETILTTYSNLENHPRLIRARDPKPVPKILLDPKTGLPFIEDSKKRTHKTKDNNVESPIRKTVTRLKDESKEEKKARKQSVKAERQARRVEKKTTKQEFTAEMHNQAKGLSNKEKTRVKKL